MAGGRRRRPPARNRSPAPGGGSAYRAGEAAAAAAGRAVAAVAGAHDLRGERGDVRDHDVRQRLPQEQLHPLLRPPFARPVLLRAPQAEPPPRPFCQNVNPPSPLPF